MTYYVVVSIRGKRKWIKAGTKQQAKKLKSQVESLEENQRIEKLGLTSKRVRIDDFFKDYLDYVRLHSSANTIKRYRGIIHTFLVFLSMFHRRIIYIDQIKQEHIESYQKERLESIDLKIAADGDKNGNHKAKRLPQPQTVNYEIDILRSAFIWAHDRELISRVPTKKVKKLKPKIEKKKRILTKEECKLFLKTAKEMAREEPRLKIYSLAFIFLLNSGLRSGELCHLTWDDVDLRTGLIKIQAKEGWSPKTYAREFFLNQLCIKLLSKLKGNEGYIFLDIAGKQLSNDKLRRTLIKIAKQAGIKDFTRVHDLRHTFNSYLQMNGVDPATMGKILGHKDIETTMIYTHQTQTHLKKSIEKVGI